MVEVHPADNAVTAALAQKHGYTDAARAMIMSQNGQELGFVLYTVERDTMELLMLFSEEKPLEELLVRACLNDAVNALATDAVCRNASHFDLLERLGFARTSEQCSIFIPSFFMRPCSGCHGA
jgi:hypothetical protein